MANEFPDDKEGPKCSVTMRKSGFSNEEIEDIVMSKVMNVFKDAEHKQKAEKSARQVIKKFCQIEGTKEGRLDKRRVSTPIAQENGVVPAPTSDSAPKSPKSLARQDDGPRYIKDWAKSIKEDQQKLFNLLLDNKRIDSTVYRPNNGYLIHLENNSRCTSVQICNMLDDLSITFAGETTSRYSPEELKEEKKLCESIVMHRIATASAFPDDILSRKGYCKWRKHLWLIASFAAMIVGLDITLSILKKT